MKTNIGKSILTTLVLAAALLTASSCTDFLNILPKGQKIPTTLTDYEAFLRNEYSVMRTDVTEALVLDNDRYVSPSYLSYYPLYAANYLWDETANRVELNKSDETTYYNAYEAISYCNLIVVNAPEATESTDAEKNVVVAYAKVVRAMCYFVVTNFYADTYDKSTASSKLSVPKIESADIDAPSKQVTIQEMYDYIISNVTEAVQYLPDMGTTILHPGKGAAYAFLARVYLQMSDFTNALKYADMALGINDKLYDWTAYYAQYQAQIEKAASYTRTPSPMDYDYVENYNYRHGTTYYSSSENNITEWRAAQFEDGDAKFLSRWKLRTVGTETYHYSTLSGFFNYGGMTTVEVYLIKAECLARGGDVSGAMAIVNKIRKTRILAAKYSDQSASNLADAMDKIMTLKRNELILTLTPFADMRRLNNEGTYKRTLTKTVGTTTYTLASDSHMWTMPFPQGATDNPGNGTLTQNVSK
jgi:tetratricopeptide (TPR) repeat protein